jgi:hypothetical protein
LDPAEPEKTFGENAAQSKDKICTTAVDGECEVYFKFGLKWMVLARYIDGTGKTNSVNIMVSQYTDPIGAYAMFTKRVVADADPAGMSVKPLAAGAAGALGGSNAYVWRGDMLVELTFGSDDPSMTPAEVSKASQQVCSALAKSIGDKLAGSPDKLPAVRLLPDANQLPLGIQVFPKDPVGLVGLGAAAVGFYKDGDKRYRLVAFLKTEGDAAKDSLKAIRAKPGALPVKDLGDEAWMITVTEGPDSPRADYIYARKGPLLIGIGDEEFVAKPTGPDPSRLSKDDKVAKLRAWLQIAKL